MNNLDKKSPRPEEHVPNFGRPNALRITDMRTVTVGWGRWRFPLMRIDTNQGLTGYGEVRDGSSKTYALMLKSRLLGENPCNVDKLFRKIKQLENTWYRTIRVSLNRQRPGIVGGHRLKQIALYPNQRILNGSEVS